MILLYGTCQCPANGGRAVRVAAWYAEQGGTVWLDSALRMKTMERQSFLPPSVNWTSEFLPIYNKVIPWGWNPSLVRRLQEAGFPDTAYPSVERMKRIRQISGRQTL